MMGYNTDALQEASLEKVGSSARDTVTVQGLAILQHLNTG